MVTLLRLYVDSNWREPADSALLFFMFWLIGSTSIGCRPSDALAVCNIGRPLVWMGHGRQSVDTRAVVSRRRIAVGRKQQIPPMRSHLGGGSPLGYSRRSRSRRGIPRSSPMRGRVLCSGDCWFGPDGSRSAVLSFSIWPTLREDPSSGLPGPNCPHSDASLSASSGLASPGASFAAWCRSSAIGGSGVGARVWTSWTWVTVSDSRGARGYCPASPVEGPGDSVTQPSYMSVGPEGGPVRGETLPGIHRALMGPVSSRLSQGLPGDAWVWSRADLCCGASPEGRQMSA